MRSGRTPANLSSPASPPTPPAAADTADATRRDPWLALALLACVFAAYWPALHGGLVWDDDAHITRGTLASWDGLRRIWFELGATQQYYPVLHSAFWIEKRLWGDAELGYHLVNASLHAFSACLLVVFCRRVGIRSAWLAGFLFALHPVAVESVAWISEQKNTLSMVFYLMAAIGWQQFDRRRRGRDYLLATFLFCLALGTKTVTATLPGALLVLVWWERGRIEFRRDVLPLIPWFMLATAGGLATAWVEKHVIGASGSEFALDPAQRLLLAFRTVWHYLSTFVWPSGLSFTYPHWQIDVRDASSYDYVVGVLVLLSSAWIYRVRNRAPLAALLAFGGSLFPVMGFLNVYPFRYAFVADHFQYHANLALFVLVGAAVSRTHERLSGARQRLLVGASAAVVLTLGVLTWRQAANYTDAETLWRATLQTNPTSWMAHHNLGRLVSRKPGGLNEAIAHYEAAIALKPDHARAHYAVGVALLRTGQTEDAIQHLQRAIALEPRNPLIVGNASFLLGLEAMKRPDGAAEALSLFSTSDRLKPGVAEIRQWLDSARVRVAVDSVARTTRR